MIFTPGLSGNAHVEIIAYISKTYNSFDEIYDVVKTRISQLFFDREIQNISLKVYHNILYFDNIHDESDESDDIEFINIGDNKITSILVVENENGDIIYKAVLYIAENAFVDNTIETSIKVQ